MLVTKEGSVRVDLVGGTLDIEPINLVLKNVVTLNVATSLKAQVQVEKNNSQTHRIFSHDYDKNYEINLSEMNFENLYKSFKFREMTFLLQLIDYFQIDFGLDIHLRSGAPAGSGLGGSSAMGVTFFSALCDLASKSYTREEKISRVKNIEARILNQGMTGYQDYYPALFGGVLALISKPGGVKLEQLYSEELINFLESHITLVYSNISRDSGINNWDVYKAFFDKDKAVLASMEEIAALSDQTYKHIRNGEFEKILDLIGLEGESRKKLSSGIVPLKVDELYTSLRRDNLVRGMKMCGAGGGGCFIITHSKEHSNIVKEKVSQASFQILDFKIERPINES